VSDEQLQAFHDGYDEGKKFARRVMLRYLVEVLGDDAEETMMQIMEEIQQDKASAPDFIIENGDVES